MRQRPWPVLLAVIVCAVGSAVAQTNVVTWHNDNARDGLNSSETILNQSNVNATHFGKICSVTVNGQIYAQPLVMSQAGKNTVYVGTMNDWVYSINGSTCQIKNQLSLIPSGEEPAECIDIGGGQCHSINPHMGILGTAVIDPSTNTIYVVAESESTVGTCGTAKKKAASCFIHRVHALDLGTLAEKFGGPVQLAGGYRGITYDSKSHIQRPGLLLLPGAMPNGDSAVYVALSSMDGSGEPGVSVPHGWIFAYDAKNLTASPEVWSSTPDGEGGGIWLSGAGLAAGVDTPGGATYIYVATGDGDFTANTGGSDYGDSFIKMTTDLVPADYFTPFSQACLNPSDLDFGSGGVMLLPNTGNAYYAVSAGKDGYIYVMNRAEPGGYSAPKNSSCPATGSNGNKEYFLGSGHKFYTTPALWNSQIYYAPMYSAITKYHLSQSSPPGCTPSPVCTISTSTTSVSLHYGTNVSISSSGNTSGTAILWAIDMNGWPAGGSPGTATLYAFDAQHSNSGVIPELWDSGKCPKRDKAGDGLKFTTPTIANGMVYVGDMDPSDPTFNHGQLDVYGLTSAECD